MSDVTPETEATITRLRDEWIGYGLAHPPLDPAAVTVAATQLYLDHKLPVPEIVYGRSPIEILDMAVERARPDLIGQMSKAATKARQTLRREYREFFCFGNQEGSWLLYYAAAEALGDAKAAEGLRGLMLMAQCAGWFLPFEDCLFVAERGTLVHDDQMRLHNETGPAIGFPDGLAAYYWHGVRVPEALVMSPEMQTTDEIMAETNAEIRRVRIQRFGFERFLREMQAKRRQADDVGVLWELPMPGDPAPDDVMVILDVPNATPEADGTYKRYLMPVPPQMERAREAAAWTFDIPEREYVLTYES